jgi:hypothetical protein
MGWLELRKRAAAVLAAVLGVAALLGACAEAEPGGGGGSPAGTARSSSAGPAGVAPPRIPSAPGLPGSPVGVDFAADGSGFALLAQCGEKRCGQSVAVLDSGADAWRPVRPPLPDVTGDLGITVGLMGLGPGHALITEGAWPPTYRTWFTRDAGRTWRRGSEKPSGTTPVVPEGGALVRDCVKVLDDNSYCERSRLLVVLPDSGEFRVLVTQPPLKGVVSPAGEVTLTDGAMSPPEGTDLLFASADDPRAHRPVLAASEDRGRTWRTAPLPGADPASHVRVTEKPLRTTIRSTARSVRFSGNVYAGHQPAALPQPLRHVEDVEA